MDRLDTSQGDKVIGIGEAKIIAVEGENSGHRVRVFHADIGASEFIPYIPTAGVYRKPRLGDSCYIFFEENFRDFPVAWGHKLSSSTIAQLVGEREDNITIIYSGGSSQNTITHRIELDDGSDNGIRIKTIGNNIIDIKNTEDILVSHNTGSFIRINENEIILSVKGSKIEMNAEGITLTSATGATTKMDADINHTSNDGSEVEVSTKVRMKSTDDSSIKIEGSIDGIAADNQAAFDRVTVANHRHFGNLGFPTSSSIIDKPGSSTE